MTVEITSDLVFKVVGAMLTVAVIPWLLWVTRSAIIARRAAKDLNGQGKKLSRIEDQLYDELKEIQIKLAKIQTTLEIKLGDSPNEQTRKQRLL